MQSTRTFLIAGVGIAVLIAGGFYYLSTKTAKAPAPGSVSTSTPIGDIGVNVDGGEVEIINIENPSVPQPSLERPLTIDPAIPQLVADQLRTNIGILTTELKKNNMQMNLWMELGNNRKIAGDTQGALEVWAYITEVAPSHYLAYSNLGDLYMHTLKDYPQAEANFKKSIELKPSHIDGYRNLYMLYRYLYKTDTELGGDILGVGLKANPDHPDLLQLLGEYQSGR